MGITCRISTMALKVVISTIDLFLVIAALALAIFGIILKTSKSVVSSLVNRLGDFETDKGSELAEWIIDVAASLSIALIVLSLVAACFYVIGFVASCFGFTLLNKIYAGFVAAVIIIIVVSTGVIFGVPHYLDEIVTKTLQVTMKNYGKVDDVSTPLWNIITSAGEPCCGLNNYTDFRDDANALLPLLPPGCCEDFVEECEGADAEDAKMKGCQEKISEFVKSQKMVIVAIPIIFIVVQALLFALIVTILYVGGISPV